MNARLCIGVTLWQEFPHRHLTTFFWAEEYVADSGTGCALLGLESRHGSFACARGFPGPASSYSFFPIRYREAHVQAQFLPVLGQSGIMGNVDGAVQRVLTLEQIILFDVAIP